MTANSIVDDVNDANPEIQLQEDSQDSEQTRDNLDQKKNRKYNKFQKEQFQRLQGIYTKDKYPQRSTLIRLSKEFYCDIMKVDNWFKHKRRKDQINGQLQNKKKKFSEQEFQILMKYFIEEKNHNQELFKKISLQISCDTSHIKNWFYYKKQLNQSLRKNLKSSMKKIKMSDEINEQIISQEHTKFERRSNRICKIKNIEQCSDPKKIQVLSSFLQKNNHNNIVNEQKQDQPSFQLDQNKQAEQFIINQYNIQMLQNIQNQYQQLFNSYNEDQILKYYYVALNQRQQQNLTFQTLM